MEFQIGDKVVLTKTGLCVPSSEVGSVFIITDIDNFNPLSKSYKIKKLKKGHEVTWIVKSYMIDMYTEFKINLEELV